MEEIKAFEYSKMKVIKDNPSKIISWITILILLLVIFLIVSIFFHFSIFKEYIGFIDISDNYDIRVMVDRSFFPVNSEYELYIDNRKYEYQITKINHLDQYSEVFIKCKLDKKVLTDNNIINVRFKKYTTTLIKEFIKRIKKGMM